MNSALDNIVNPKNWEFEQNSGGVVWMFTNYARPARAAAELAELRAELAKAQRNEKRWRAFAEKQNAALLAIINAEV